MTQLSLCIEPAPAPNVHAVIQQLAIQKTEANTRMQDLVIQAMGINTDAEQDPIYPDEVPEWIDLFRLGCVIRYLPSPEAPARAAHLAEAIRSLVRRGELLESKRYHGASQPGPGYEGYRPQWRLP